MKSNSGRIVPNESRAVSADGSNQNGCRKIGSLRKERMDDSAHRDIGKALAEQLTALTANAAAVEADRCLYCYDAPAPMPAHPYRYSALHQEDRFAETCAARADYICFKSFGRYMRSCMPSAGAVRRRMRAGRRPQAYRHWTTAAIRHGLRPRTRSYPVVKAAPTGRSIAVIGAGPAGLSCAGELAMLGHAGDDL